MRPCQSGPMCPMCQESEQSQTIGSALPQTAMSSLEQMRMALQKIGALGRITLTKPRDHNLWTLVDILYSFKSGSGQTR